MTTGRDANPFTIPPVSTAQLAEAALPGALGDTSSRQLLASELEHLQDRRHAHGLGEPTPDNLTGLALSGGGIRSATFSLGVLQALAKYDLLKRFDYLSTVSGGGYTGASLTWWLSPQSGVKAEVPPEKAFGLGKKDFPYGTDNPTIWRGQLGTEPGPRLLTNLRKHGNYLAPGGGIRLLSAVAVVLRAVLVNLILWLPLLTLVMLAVLAGLWSLFEASPEPPAKAALASAGIVQLILIDGGIVAVILAAMAGVYFALLARPHAWASKAAASAEAKDASPPLAARFVVALVDGRLWGVWTALLGAIVVFMLWLVPPEPKDHWHGLRILLAGAAILGTTFVLCTMVYALASRWRGPIRPFSYQLRRMFETWAAVYLPLIAVLVLLGTLPDVAAWLSEAPAPAPEVGGAEVAPEAQPGSEAGGGLLALLAGIAAAGAAFLRSSARVTGMLRERGFKVAGGFTATLAAALLLTGVLLITHDLAVRLYFADGTRTVVSGLIAFVLVAALMVNLNHISLGRFYRDRLMEAFMPGYAQALAGGIGAAPPEADEMRLHQASKAAPYHIVNTNVVLINAGDRRRCLRGGDSFVLTPKWCGSNATGWCRTEVFMNDGMTLATAMGISGAAANPNTGVGGVGLTRSRAVSVLMALLNLRLGYWVPHPGPRRQANGSWSHRPWARQSAVPNHFWPGLWALLRGYHETYSFQELTDGGHFENLGIYELIRRRVRLILVCDGGQDPEFAFEDLQTALRRVGEDFGAKIEFVNGHPMEDMMSRPVDACYPRNLRLARRGFAVARIHYPPDFDQYGLLKETRDRPESILIYLKTTMVGGLPLELRGYSGKNPEFPDQSTSDQFFDEDQFEAYRELGYRIAKAMIEDIDLGARLAEIQPQMTPPPAGATARQQRREVVSG